MKRIIISLVIIFFSFSYVSAGGPSKSYFENHPNGGTMGSTYWETKYKINKEKFNMYDFQNYTYDLTIFLKKDHRTKTVCKKQVRNGIELQIRGKDDICNKFSLFPSLGFISSFSFDKKYNYPDKYNSFFDSEIIISNFKLSLSDKKRYEKLEQLRNLYKKLDRVSMDWNTNIKMYCDIMNNNYIGKNSKLDKVSILVRNYKNNVKVKEFTTNNIKEISPFCVEKDYNFKDILNHQIIIYQNINGVNVEYIPKKEEEIINHINKLQKLLQEIKFKISFSKEKNFFSLIEINTGREKNIYKFYNYHLKKDIEENINVYAKQCKFPENLFSKKMFFYYSFIRATDFDYQLNYNLTKKLDNMFKKFDNYNVNKQKKVLRLINKKLFHLWKKYTYKLQNKYGNINIKKLKEKEERTIKLFIGLNNYFRKKFDLIHREEFGSTKFILKNGEELKLNSSRYRYFSEDNCTTVYIGNRIIYENSDIKYNRNYSYKIIENGYKIYLLKSYKRVGEKYVYLEIYKIGKNLSAFKQPIKTLKLNPLDFDYNAYGFGNKVINKVYKILKVD